MAGKGSSSGAPQGQGILGSSWVEDNWKQQDMPSMARDFVNPGDSPLQLLMRTMLFTDQEVNAATLFLTKCNLIGWKEGKELLLAKLAARRSLSGTSMEQLLALGIGAYPGGGITSPAARKDRKAAPAREEERE